MTVQDAERLELQAKPASVGEARTFVRRVLTEWGCDEVVDNVTLLTSELATNAVLHARTSFAVRIRRFGEQVRVDVLDLSPVPARRRRGSLSASTGRGVAMVARLSQEWGETEPADLVGYVKGVWFMVPVVGQAGSPWDGDWTASG